MPVTIAADFKKESGAFISRDKEDKEMKEDYVMNKILNHGVLQYTHSI